MIGCQCRRDNWLDDQRLGFGEIWLQIHGHGLPRLHCWLYGYLLHCPEYPNAASWRDSLRYCPSSPTIPNPHALGSSSADNQTLTAVGNISNPSVERLRAVLDEHTLTYRQSLSRMHRKSALWPCEAISRLTSTSAGAWGKKLGSASSWLC